jgi:hypothetical protein
MKHRTLEQIEQRLRAKLGEQMTPRKGEKDYRQMDLGGGGGQFSGGGTFGIGGRGGSPMNIDIGPGGAGRGSFKPDLKGPAAARARDRAEAERIMAQQNKPFEPPAPAPPKPTTPPPAAKPEPKAAPPADKASLRDRLNQARYGTTDRKETDKRKQ